MRKVGLGLVGLSMLLGGVGCSAVCPDLVYETSGQAPSAGPNAGSSGTGGNAKPSDSAEGAIDEADVIRVEGDRLFALSRTGGLAIVDVTPGKKLALEGKARLSGVPFEMYKRGNVVLAMSTQAVGKDGAIVAAAGDASATGAGSTPATGAGGAGASAPAPVGAPVDESLGSLVTAIDASDPRAPRSIAMFPITGHVADSRIVGDVLYVLTYENGQCYKCSGAAKTVLTSFDVSDPAKIHEINHDTFEAEYAGPTTSTGAAWKRSMVATDSRIYIGGLGGSKGGLKSEGVIDVVDISDATGHFARGPRLSVTGPILSRWQMDESGGVLRVVSQRGAAYSSVGTGEPTIQTFDAKGNYASIAQIGIRLPRQELLRTVRFDGPRGYAITFNQTDPLFVLDLSDPAAPSQLGELEMPGWIFHIEPHGDRLLGLGVDSRSGRGALNVSLFDVKDGRFPRLLSRVPFGAQLGQDRANIDYQLPEDQDRIQKAFKVLDDGLVVVPYSGARNACAATNVDGKGGLQLIDWRGDTLADGGLLRMAGTPRRAFVSGQDILGVSDSAVVRFDRSTQLESSSVTIGQCRSQTGQVGYGDGMNDYGYGYGYGNDYVDSSSGPFYCGL